MSLLPSQGPDASAVQEGEVEVVGVDEDVDELLDALASDTARDVLTAIYEEPGTPSEIADRLEMSIQKVSYHLDKLEDQDLIAVAGTRYSEKGQEMKVYEPPDDPLVLFVGTNERKQSLRDLVKRLLPAIGVLAAGSLLVQRFLGPDGAASQGAPVDLTSSDRVAGGTETGGQAGAESTDGGDVGIYSSADTPEATGTEYAPDGVDAFGQTAGQPLDPGLVFFLGGAVVLSLVVAWWAYRRYAQNEI